MPWFPEALGGGRDRRSLGIQKLGLDHKNWDLIKPFNMRIEPTQKVCLARYCQWIGFR